MSWLLKRKFKFGLIALTCCAVVFFSLDYRIPALIVAVILCFIPAFLYINRLIRRKNEAPRAVFSLNTACPRNFDFLVIGEYCQVQDLIPDGSKYIEFLAPGRSIEASFLIFKHVSSLLKENGNAVFLVDSRKLSSKAIGPFDVPFLHPVTVRHLCLESTVKKSRYPLLFSPIKSIQLMLNPQPRPLKESSHPQYEDMRSFCAARSIHMLVLAI